MLNPLASNPLLTRANMQTAVRDLFAPLQPHFSQGAARVRLGYQGHGQRAWFLEIKRRGLSWAHRLPFGPAKEFANRNERAPELESFTRPLWGLVPLAAGGGAFTDWDLYRRGLSNGADPRHPEYWGLPADNDQRLVEMAAIGFALALAPHEVWEPLEPRAKANLARWLLEINRCAVSDNNWLFFRVLVNLGLARVGAPHDPAAMQAALDRLETFYLGDGWYSDGPGAQRDYYVAWAMHFYGLLYSNLAAELDPERAQRFRERTALFAQDFIHWFGADGAALPFGRSLTYRFAQGSFWGALAFAEVEALPWAVLKGLVLRHIQAWSRRPIFNSDGTLSIGYGYSHLNMAEQYNAPGSPYWALKFFLPLALPATHPFWQAEAAPQPSLAPVKPLPHAGMIVCRDPERPHVFVLAAGQHAMWARHGAPKYAKFAYSTLFGFSVPAGGRGLEQAAADSMLALSDDAVHYRVREVPLDARIEARGLYARWQPWPGVEVDTWLVPNPPWHLRLHRLRCDRPLWSAEGGFALDGAVEAVRHEVGAGLALAHYPAGAGGLRDLFGQRTGQVLTVAPNTNLMAPRTVLPTLLGQHAAGEHWLACAVVAVPDPGRWERVWAACPECPPWFSELARAASLQISPAVLVDENPFRLSLYAHCDSDPAL
jgi:hypothetical protein